MKLTDLDPKFYGMGGEGISNAEGTPVPARKGMGLIFNCPCGKCNEMRRLAIPFANPLDGGPPYDEKIGRGALWQRTGDTFETLTLTPSILRMEECKWHGFITNGEIITV